MKSRTTKRFRQALSLLPSHIRKLAEKTYSKWKVNPWHPGLQFKKIHNQESMYSVRISLGYRALGMKEGNTIIWFWIGSHSEYNKMIAELRTLIL